MPCLGMGRERSIFTLQKPKVEFCPLLDSCSPVPGMELLLSLAWTSMPLASAVLRSFRSNYGVHCSLRQNHCFPKGQGSPHPAVTAWWAPSLALQAFLILRGIGCGCLRHSVLPQSSRLPAFPSSLSECHQEVPSASFIYLLKDRRRHRTMIPSPVPPCSLSPGSCFS